MNIKLVAIINFNLIQCMYVCLIGIVNFNHRYGCQKCIVEGEYSNHTMSFVNLDAVRRTDTMFRGREHPEHHHRDSVLEELDIDMIKSFSIADTLHLFELGIP